MAHLQYLVFNNENIPMPASGRNHAEGCCPGRRGSDRSDLPCIEEVAE